MAQKNKGKATVRSGARKKGKSGASWQGRRDEKKSGFIAVIAMVSILGLLVGSLLQGSAIFTDRTDLQVDAGIRINEIVSENVSTLITEEGDVPDWVEITNTGDKAVDIGHYSLLLESDVSKVFSFPNYVLQPGEYLIIYCDGSKLSGSAYWHASFKLAASGGDTLVLLNNKSRMVDAVELPLLNADASYSRNGAGEWIVTTATPGALNSNLEGAALAAAKGQVRVIPGEVEISEVLASNTLYFPDENGVYRDYVEIHNTSDSDVNLKGWYLSDSGDKLKRWAFPSVVVKANGYLAVHCSGEDRTEDVNHLHTDFKISSDGETVYLTRPDGRTASAVEVPELLANQAYSYADGAWSKDLAPTPALSNDAEAAAYVHSRRFGDRSSDVYISEVMAAPGDQPYDWVEIYNGSNQTVDLSNYGLSDSADKPRKWQFPRGTAIQSGEYKCICLSGTGETDINGFLNADFALDAAGGYTMTLADPNGDVLDALYLPQQYGGISYGRASGENGFYFFAEATPGAYNGSTRYRARAQEAEVSVRGGLHRSGDRFTVELTAPAGSRIYYTLDCTDPTDRSNLYSGPIEVSGTTILRSRVYRDGYMPSFIDTQSYLYDVNVEGDVYVVSVVSDTDSLMGEGGLLSDYLEKIEVSGHVEVFTSDGTCAVGQNCGLALHGQDSRKKDVKSFDVIARTIYGDNRFDYPLFSERDYTSYQSFLLRPSGEDQNMSFMRDTVLSSLMRVSSVLFQEHEIAVMYLNGRYYTLCYMRERINEHSISQFEGWVGVEDDIDLIKANTLVNQGSNETFEALRQWVRNNDTSTVEAYQLIDSQIDVQNFIEYMSLQIFVGNTDTLNVRRYRCDKMDGKWRWALYDLDWAFFNDTDSIGKWLTPGGTGAGRATDNSLFIGCMKNPIFREQFLTHFGRQMATVFSTENVVAEFYAQQARLAPMIEQYKQQWNYSLSGVKKVYAYAEERPAKIIKYFRDALDLSDADMQKYFGDAIAEIQRYESSKQG